VKVLINGSEVEFDTGARVSDAIATVKKGDSKRGIAVAVNGTVVPRSSWEETRLDDADRVEILTAVAGG
jgi:sulfur carrier protein